jgi:thiosulfate/3-mercaptopyruvate sulfurtransferase
VSSRPSPLIDAADLLASIDDPRLRLADVRWVLGSPDQGRRTFEAGHLPGAAFIDLEHDLSAETGPGRHPLPDPAAFARRMGELGFGTDDRIVVYDDAGGTVAARLWWMLDALEHRDTRLLDGGIDAWLAAGGELVTGHIARPPADLALAATWPRTLDRAEIARRRPGRALVDMRAPERYRGEVEPVDPVAGHIPGALALPALALLGEDKRLLSPEDLRRRLSTVLPEVDGIELVVSCGSGVTACLGVLATRVAGLPDATLYPGSYSDWSRSGMPIATGDEPG